jgi:hypothetical protein
VFFPYEWFDPISGTRVDDFPMNGLIQSLVSLDYQGAQIVKYISHEPLHQNRCLSTPWEDQDTNYNIFHGAIIRFDL